MTDGRDEYRKLIRATLASLLARDDMLSEERAAAMMDCTPAELQGAVFQGRVVELVAPELKYVYPEWQFRYDGQPADAIADLISLFDGNQVAVAEFMVDRHELLGGLTGAEHLRRSREPRLVEAANAWPRFALFMARGRDETATSERTDAATARQAEQNLAPGTI